MKVTDRQKAMLKVYISNLDELLAQDDINELLMAIDDEIIGTFDENDYPSKEGIALQHIYDEIYLANGD